MISTAAAVAIAAAFCLGPVAWISAQGREQRRRRVRWEAPRKRRPPIRYLVAAHRDSRRGA